MKPTGEGRGLSEVRGRIGLQVRRVARPEMWVGWVGGKFRLAGLRGWQFWTRDEHPHGPEVRRCCWPQVSAVTR